MPNYTYICPQCHKGQEVIKAIDLRYAVPVCGWCGVKTKLAMGPVAMLGREKPGTISAAIDRGIKQADGNASVAAGLRRAEEIGGDHWKKVKAEHDPGHIQESLNWAKAN